MKDTIIEVWVDKPENIISKLAGGTWPSCSNTNFSWNRTKANSCKYKIAMTFEMPQKEATITESQFDDFVYHNVAQCHHSDADEFRKKLFGEKLDNETV